MPKNIDGHIYIMAILKVRTCDFPHYKIFDSFDEVIEEIKKLSSYFCIQYIDSVEIHKVTKKSSFKCKLRKSFLKTIDHEDDKDCCMNNEEIKTLNKKDFIFEIDHTFDLADYLLDMISFDDCDDGIGGKIEEICDLLYMDNFLDAFINIMIYRDHSEFGNDTIRKLYEMLSIMLKNTVFRKQYDKERTKMLMRLNRD